VASVRGMRVRGSEQRGARAARPLWTHPSWCRAAAAHNTSAHTRSRSRLTQIFAISGAHLYHAYAWLKLFNFSRSFNKNLTASDTQVRL
jgi:hypothetical protein